MWEGEISFHDGMLSEEIEGFTEVSTYCDGAMHTWSLFIRTTCDGAYGLMVGQANYLPVYILKNSDEVVEAIKFLEATLCCTSLDDDDFLNDY